MLLNRCSLLCEAVHGVTRATAGQALCRRAGHLPTCCCCIGLPMLRGWSTDKLKTTLNASKKARGRRRRTVLITEAAASPLKTSCQGNTMLRAVCQPTPSDQLSELRRRLTEEEPSGANWNVDFCLSSSSSFPLLSSVWLTAWSQAPGEIRPRLRLNSVRYSFHCHLVIFDSMSSRSFPQVFFVKPTSEGLRVVAEPYKATYSPPLPA